NTSRRWFAATAAVSPSHNTLANPAIPAAIFLDVFMVTVYLVGSRYSVRHIAMHCSMNVYRRGSMLFATNEPKQHRVTWADRLANPTLKEFPCISC
ncbi:MAG: hypothetical protein ABWY02_09065, partial [Telluria sp.]